MLQKKKKKKKKKRKNNQCLIPKHNHLNYNYPKVTILSNLTIKLSFFSLYFFYFEKVFFHRYIFLLL